MKVKTSVTLSRELLNEIDRVAGPGCNRSALIEEATRDWLRRRARDEAFEDEVARLNAVVDGPEPPDVLSFTAGAEELGDQDESW